MSKGNKTRWNAPGETMHLHQRHWLPKPSKLNTNKRILTKCTHMYAIWIWSMPLNADGSYNLVTLNIHHRIDSFSLSLVPDSFFFAIASPFRINSRRFGFSVCFNRISAASINHYAYIIIINVPLASNPGEFIYCIENLDHSRKTIKQLDDYHLCFSTRTYFSVLFYNRPINQHNWIYNFSPFSWWSIEMLQNVQLFSGQPLFRLQCKNATKLFFQRNV